MSANDPLHQHYLTIKQYLSNEFRVQEVRDICLELGFNPEHLPSHTLLELVDSLLQVVDHKSLREELITILRRDRPSIPWPDAYRYPRAPEPKQDRPPHTPPPRPANWSDIYPPGPLPPGSFLPYDPNPLFTGRERELQTLAETLLAKADGRPLAITTSGMGGVGKTQLAVEFAHRYGRWFPGGVFWISFAGESEGAIHAAIAASAQYLELPGYDRLELAQQVALVRRAWNDPLERLLIFDNCEDARLLAAWKPKQGGCRVLVTSRVSEWPAEMNLERLPLRTLPRPQSIELLSRYLSTPQRPLPADYNTLLTAYGSLLTDLDAIAAELGDLPLALKLSGSYLKRYRDVSPAAYLDALRQTDPLAHPALRGAWLHPALDATGHDVDVGRTFALSYERLRPTASDTDRLALALLARAALFAPGEPIPRSLLLATATGETDHESDSMPVATDALHRLSELGLAEVEEGATAGEDTVRLHRLVAAFARAAAADETAQTGVEQAVIDLAYEQNMAGYPAALRAWDVHLRHVTQAALEREDNQAVTLATNLGYYLKMSGDLAGARPYHERALAIRERVLGRDHPDTATSLNNLGYLLQAQGDLAGARPYFERALAISETKLGP
jgi:tetratricopeptide (TPR) repeat protein